MSEYERLVELAAKGLAERDNHAMPKSVTTPEDFYEIMAGAALDAIGLRELLEEVEVARAQQDLTIPDEAPSGPLNADAPAARSDEPPDASLYAPNAPAATRSLWEDGAYYAGSQLEREPRKVEIIHFRRRWATTAEEHLNVVTAAVADLRKVLAVDAEMLFDVDADIASKVVVACGSLEGWLGGTRAPRGLAKAEGELGAAAGVYRNAAIVFGKLKDVEGYQRHTRSNACALLLGQGDDHVDAFVVAVEKKLSL